MPRFLLPALAAALMAAALPARAAVAVDLGDAGAFSAITFGDFSGYGGDTGSLLGVGGNARLQNWTVNDDQLPGYHGYSLIVGGNLQGLSGKVQGNAWVGGSVSTSNFSMAAPATGATPPLDFTSLYGHLTATSSATATATPTGTVGYAGGSTVLTGTGGSVEVFDVDGSELSHDTFLTATGIRQDATVILNISGSDVSMKSFGIDLANPSTQPNLLLNFYEAKTLSFANIAVEGAVLAPWADVTGISGHIGGTFIAQSFHSGEVGDFEFHDINFNPVVVPSPVPEPGVWALLLAGLVAPAARRLSRPWPRRAARYAPVSSPG